jgi:hypothetical protein
MREIQFAALLFLSVSCATGADTKSSQSIVALDERRREMILRADVDALERLAHRNLAINAPLGRVLSREQFLANMRSGAISAEEFSRTVEDVRISGDVAVVMGNETFTPAPASELGRIYGATPLPRRYTNVYLWENGRWRWLARHANVER